MEINNIKVHNSGYISCKSCFYSSKDILSSDLEFNFSKGINRLNGEIDSGVWAISYLLSMYKYRPKDFILFEQPKVIVNNSIQMSINDILNYSCYMDETLYPMFSSKKSVSKLVSDGIKKNKLNYTLEDVKDLFELDSQRFERSIQQVGNEKFRAMAAIGYCNNKQIFCFPWLSQKRFEYYHGNLTVLLAMLERLKKIVIIPVGI